MKKSIVMLLVMTMLSISSTEVLANVGDMGFFGGISEGRKLPKTTESMLDVVKSKGEYVYKEKILLGLTPYEFEGVIQISETKPLEDDLGSYKKTMTVRASDTTNEEISIDRKITFNVNYRREYGSVVTDYEIDSWSEKIVTPAGEYELDRKQSYFGVSVLEEVKPGITYYKGNISKELLYIKDGNGGNPIKVSEIGTIFGYDNPWSSTETHRSNVTVSTNEYNIQYQIRPSITVNKKLDYGTNEPQLISFGGNYKEVISNTSGLKYDYTYKPTMMHEVSNSGEGSIRSYNSFEQLIAPNLDHLKGHFAYFDILKLYSIGVLEGEAKYYIPNQAITRGDYVSMLGRAIKLDTKNYEEVGTRNNPIRIVFPDVQLKTKNYPMIMTAYDRGLAVGRSDGKFYVDDYLTREEAVVMLLRTVGLENLGLEPTTMTSFVDDNEISSWAKKEVYASEKIGLIKRGLDGKFRPKGKITKAEASALVNRLIEYMRYDMEQDYVNNIINFYINE